MNRWGEASPSSGAGQGQWSPAKASNLSSVEGRDSRRRHNEPMQKRKRRFVVLDDDEEEEDNEVEEKRSRAEPGSGESEEEEAEEAKPIGDVVRVSGSGDRKVNHYRAFEYAGNRYALEDAVLICAEDERLKPYVAIIKDITDNISNGKVMLTGQCFYRPEDAKNKGGGRWQKSDSRELFYSFHLEEFTAESVMHTCVVNYVPLHKQLPNRRQFPGFIVQKMYDTERKELFKLTDKEYEDTRQSEIGLLLNETVARVGDLPDLEDEGASKYHTILANFCAMTKESQRDYWLGKLLESVEYVCTSSGAIQQEKESSQHKGSSHLSVKKDENQITWPDYAVTAVSALERAINKEFSPDLTKYKQKMRQLEYNLKKNVLLAQRLLKGELKPSVILNMSATELKEGLTAEEIARNKPEDTIHMQMTAARCRLCSEKNVGVANIIKAGLTFRYELECLNCGHKEYISHNKAATMNIYASSTIKSPEKKS